jgi:hypothetical protein
MASLYTVEKHPGEAFEETHQIHYKNARIPVMAVGALSTRAPPGDVSLYTCEEWEHATDEAPWWSWSSSSGLCCPGDAENNYEPIYPEGAELHEHRGARLVKTDG